jgi:hypothetical protein
MLSALLVHAGDCRFYCPRGIIITGTTDDDILNHAIDDTLLTKRSRRV